MPYKSSEAPTLETPLPLEKRVGTPPKLVGGEVDLLQRHLAAKTFSERLWTLLLPLLVTSRIRRTAPILLRSSFAASAMADCLNRNPEA